MLFLVLNIYIFSPRTPDEPCSGEISLPFGFVSKCKQKFIKKKLLALDADGQGTSSENFFIPSCCVCHVTRTTQRRWQSRNCIVLKYKTKWNDVYCIRKSADSLGILKECSKVWKCFPHLCKFICSSKHYWKFILTDFCNSKFMSTVFFSTV